MRVLERCEHREVRYTNLPYAQRSQSGWQLVGRIDPLYLLARRVEWRRGGCMDAFNELHGAQASSDLTTRCVAKALIKTVPPCSTNPTIKVRSSVMCPHAAEHTKSMEYIATPQELESLVRQSTETVRSLSARLLRVQDEERRRLARELHDSTGQTLAALKMQVSALQQRLKNGATGTDCLVQINALADQALRDIRTTSYLLFPPMLDESGFCSAAEWYVSGFSKRSNIRVKLELASPGRLPRLVETALFRVLQESLTNIYRHSGSPVADVRMNHHSAQAILEIRDYGSGIPASVLEQLRRAGTGGGVGLAGMRERMHAFGGKLEIFSAPSGTLVRASVPTERLASGGSSQTIPTTTLGGAVST